MESTISVVSSKALLTLFGACDQHLRRIRNALGVSITARDGRIHIVGPEPAVASATEVLEQLQACANRHGHAVARRREPGAGGRAERRRPPAEHPPVDVFRAGRQIRPRTPGQARYLEAIRQHDIVLCYGPAGTGKTYLAVAMAVAALKRRVDPQDRAGAARPSRPAKASASCPATCRPRSTPTCGRCWTPCTR